MRTVDPRPRGAVLLRHLSRLDVFAGCNRSQLRRIARLGDVVEVERGAELVREDRPDYWLYIVLAGSVQISRRGRDVGRVGRGGYIGHEAIVGFGLQSHTAVADSHCLLFVVGRRPLLTLVQTIPSVQRSLFPKSALVGYEAVRRELFEHGNREWEQAAKAWGIGPDRRLENLPESFRALHVAGRPASRSALTDALTGLLEPHAEHAHIDDGRPALSARARAVLAAGIVVMVIGFGASYHPPFAVVGAGHPVDVVSDITVAGGGRPQASPYLLLSVRIEQRSIFRTAAARATGKSVVSLESSTSQEDRGRADFRQSEARAVSAAASVVGVEESKLAIAFADRDVRGSSAGLAYALALVDLLHPDDIARGRVVAATGVLDEDGGVGRVGFVSLKARVAKAGGAEVMFVPAGQEALARGTVKHVYGVRTLAEAVEILRSPDGAQEPPRRG